MKRFLYITLLIGTISVSCFADSKFFCSADLGIVRLEDNAVVMLEMVVDSVLPLFGEPDQVETIPYTEGETNIYDKLQMKYEGISFWYFRGFEIIYHIVITDPEYKSIAGFGVGDNLRDVKRVFGGLKEYDDFAVLSFFDGETERGFGLDYDSNGTITRMTLSVFSP